MEARIEEMFGDEKDVDLVEYITGTLDGDDYERGALEGARHTADNACVLLAKLIEVLAVKAILIDSDLLELLKHHVDEIELKR